MMNNENLEIEENSILDQDFKKDSQGQQKASGTKDEHMSVPASKNNQEHAQDKNMQQSNHNKNQQPSEDVDQEINDINQEN